MTRITLEAHAKINLYLKVLGRRPDGFHDLDSLLQTISLHDTLRMEEGDEGFGLEVDDPAVPADATNLVVRAAQEILKAAGGARRGVRIVLAKRIPAGAGLGGGSSDAAAALVGLDRLWGLRLGEESLRRVAASLGSDVPYFLDGGTAHLTGRGTEVEPLKDLPVSPLLVVFPGTLLSTREVYAQLHVPLTPPPETSSIPRFGPGSPRSADGWVRLGNDLEVGARRLCPAIGEIKERLLDVGALAASMTGSGSAVFGVFGEAAAAERAARRLERPGWRVLRCAMVPRADHRRFLGLA